MNIDELKQRQKEILVIAAKPGAYNVQIFGSVARGEAEPESDIDFLVDVSEQRSSWFPVGLKLEQDFLGREIDVATEKSLHPLVRERILQEAVAL
jgi:predicted nucleotidyltransferase